MNVGKILMSDEQLLRFLQLGGYQGRVLGVSKGEDVTEFLIEHPDMPDTRVDEFVPVVNLEFTTYEDCMGNRVAIRTGIV